MSPKIELVPLVLVGIAEPPDKIVPVDDRNPDAANTQFMPRGQPRGARSENYHMFILIHNH